jgi:CheY-like chemotaxis protein
MPPSILAIDDDPSIRAVLSDALSDEGYAVQCAANGAEGLRAIDQAVPALVLLDMRMPVLDGWGFARMLRDRGVRIPIVVMTAAQDARQWAQEVGAIGYVAKPFDLIELLDAVGRCIA